jgi:alpha/beta superfamily hydrolase
MKQIILLFFIIGIVFNALGQSNYRSPIYSIKEDSNIVYGIDTNFKGCLDTLNLDIYKPVNDDTCRPLLIMIHGGSFVDGDKTDAEEVYIAQSMASRGYVVASINYRLGYQLTSQVLNPLSDCGGYIANYCYYLADTSELIRAGYRAMQDARGAIRFMKGRHNSDSTNINSAFVGGFSAGAVTALLVDFLDTSAKRPPDTYQIADVLQPNSATTCPLNNPCNSTSLARPDLGEIQGSTNINGYNASVQATLSFCGAILNLDTTSLLTVGKEPGLFLYHQTCDDIVPCYRGQVYGPINNCLYYCTSCSPVTGVPYCYGGGSIASFIRSHPSLGITCDSQIVSRGAAINSYYGCLFGNSNEPYCANTDFLNCHAIVLDTALMDIVANFLSPFINSCNNASAIAGVTPVHPQFTVLNNPSSDFWTICNSNPKIKIISTKLFSALGTTVPLVLNYRDNCISIASSELPDGVYFLRLETNEGATTIKLVRY